MTIRNESLKPGVLNLAVQSALAVMFAMPLAAAATDSLEEEVATIRRPTNYVEIGAMNVNRDSAKFGEYNGLDKSGVDLIGNFSLRGGDAYQGGDGTTRWGLKGTDLGTTSRELGASYENQGRWSVRFGHDELRHNITDTYQTPQQGSMGGNTFTLPAGFGVYNGATSATTTTTPPSTRAVPASALHTEDVGTTRKNTSLGATLNLGRQLSLDFDYNRLSQSGAKLMASASSGGFATGGVGTWRAESIAVVMNPTNYKTDTITLALKWVGDKGHLSGGYYGSFFRDGYDRLSWQNPIVNAAGNTASGYQTVTMSTAPNNDLHQFNLSGGYAFSSTTKLAGGMSYGRNTQNQGFLLDQTGANGGDIISSPASSLNGKVITKHLDIKLSHQATRNLALAAAYRVDERDNQSPSMLYSFYAINNRTTADNASNAPYSHKKGNLELAGDYRFDKRQSVRLAYNREKIERWCNEYALTSNCLIATSNTEDKVDAKYRLKATDSVSLSAGYGHARRKGSYEFNAVTPLGGLDLATPTDVNSQNYPGFVAMPYAERKRDVLRAGANWQATQALDFGIEARHARDKYDPVLGAQSVKTTGINLDATFSYSENATVSAYASWQSSKRDMRIGASGGTADNTATSYALLIAPTNIWTNQLDEDGQTFGINTRHKLIGGRLELIGDISYSLDKSHYATQAPYTSGATLCSLATQLTCGDLPDIKSELVTLKLTGIYSLSKSSKVSVGYLYQKLKSDDYAYNWFQLGYTGTRGMPTNQQAPNYTVNVIAASYIYNFK